MSYPPQNPYSPGPVPAPGSQPPADGQYGMPPTVSPMVPPMAQPPNPTAPMPAAPNPTAPMPAADGGYGAQPVFGAPAGQPAPAGYDQGFNPASAPPVSAPPPFSAPPAMPYGAPGAAGVPPAAGFPGAAKPKPTVLILAIVAGLLFVLGGVMTGLYISTNNELDSTRTDLTAKVAERDGTISTKDGELSKLRSDLEKANAELDSTQQTLTGTQNERDQVQKEKAAISKCLTLMNDLIGAAQAQDRTKTNKLIPQVDKACSEAEKYL